MYKVQNITNSPRQSQSLIFPAGGVIQISMYYIEMQQGWFLTNLTYGSFVLNGLRICNSPNMLHQFRNQIPFGLACASKDNREPFFIDDFSSGASSLYVLTADEVVQYNTIISAGV